VGDDLRRLLLAVQGGRRRIGRWCSIYACWGRRGEHYNEGEGAACARTFSSLKRKEIVAVIYRAGVHVLLTTVDFYQKTPRRKVRSAHAGKKLSTRGGGMADGRGQFSGEMHLFLLSTRELGEGGDPGRSR